MIGLSSKSIVSKLVRNQTKNFSQFRKTVYDMLNRDDPQSSHFKAASYNPLLPLEGHVPKYVESQPQTHQVTTLSNGIKVLTESQGVPSVVDLGVLINMGTRDETNESSGSCLSIKNTYLKTVLNTNETVNYGMVQMSGGKILLI